MTRILVVNGPNLGHLGTREPRVYGRSTLDDITQAIARRAHELDVEVVFSQSNHEGALIDAVGEENDRADALIINPGGLSHTSVALADAMRSFSGLVIEYHISNVFAREDFRQVMVTAGAADGVIIGLGASGYVLALEAAVRGVEERSQLRGSA